MSVGRVVLFLLLVVFDWSCPLTDAKAGRDNVFIFIQVSDLHVSVYRDRDVVPEMKRFIKSYLPIIKPQLLLFSGDLVDAKVANKQGSRQILEEWLEYVQVLDTFRAVNERLGGSIKFIDIRGNHDVFNLVDTYANDKQNFYNLYSWSKRPGHFAETVQMPFGRYTFVVADACPKIGPKRPFNFFGFLFDDDVAELNRLDRLHAGDNMTFWTKAGCGVLFSNQSVSHYTMSTMFSPVPIRDIMQNGIAYMCGHLHTLNGLAPTMYSRSAQGDDPAALLELELADWKDERRFRVGIVDHDVFSFVDGSFDKWPILVVTNPKAAQYLVPSKERVQRLRTTRHVRLFCFSPFPVEKVLVWVNGETIGEAVAEGDGLFIVPWQPERYADNDSLHVLRATCEDRAGHHTEVKFEFTLDAERATKSHSFPWLPSAVLTSDIHWFIRAVFLAAVLPFVLLFGLLRVALASAVRLARNWTRRGCALRCLARPLKWMVALVANRPLFIFVIVHICFIVAGPHFVGEVIDGHWGVQFAWGIIVLGHYLPGEVTLIYAVGHLALVAYPSLFLLGFLTYNASRRKASAASTQNRISRVELCTIVFSLVIIEAFLAFFTVHYYLTYGTAATILNPPNLWTLLLMPVVVWAAVKRPTEVQLEVLRPLFSAEGIREASKDS